MIPATHAENCLSAVAAQFAGVNHGPEPLLRAAVGLAHLAQAAGQADLLSAPKDDVTNALLAVIAAEPAIIEAARGDIGSDRVFVGLCAACGLLHPDTDGLQSERVDHTRLFAAELAAVHLRQAIAAKGDRLRRFIKLRELWTRPHDGATPH